MMTPAERNSLFLTLGFLLLGAGIKGWKKWRVEIGPFDPTAPTVASPLDKAAPAGGLPAAADSADADTSHAMVHRSDSSQESSGTHLPAYPRKPARSPQGKPSKPASACPVDPNTASEAALTRLPGVGPSTAAALVARRKAQGPYRDVRELLEVKGIGEKKLALIAPCLIISGAGGDPPPMQASVEPEAGEAEPARP